MLDQHIVYEPPGATAARQRYIVSQRPAIARSRPIDNLTGKEVVTRSSRKPVIVRPPLEITPMELSKHRADTHTRVAHWISNGIAHVTGALDGVTDAAANGTGELIENGAFFVSKVVHGVKHGWSRGKFPDGQDQ